MTIEDLRRTYHQTLCSGVLFWREGGIPNIADRHSRVSVALAQEMVHQMGYPLPDQSVSAQTAGLAFETVTETYIEAAFTLLHKLRPGQWLFSLNADITQFEQYEHLAQLEQVLQEHRDLKAALGDYIIKPDIIIARVPISDEALNQPDELLGSDLVSLLTPLRADNTPDPKPILHASISCKWTMRSERPQNVRTEGLNLIRNRKGHTPHIAIVTAEPYPQRIASLALGTGDIDCVYHIALPELETAVEIYDSPPVTDMLNTLIEGKRLRDISDLPFDLAI